VRAALAIVLGLTATARADELPKLESPSVVVVDGEGREVLARHADDVRPIASMTKIFAALVVRARKLDLEAWTEITDVDANAAEGGAPTSLLRGLTFRNIDLLHAMLLVSDNRVPTALARSVGMSQRQLLAEMNALAKKLGLEHTKFDDVTGIGGNKSTAREMAIAMQAVLADPVLARIMRTRYARITSQDGEKTVDYKSTVKPLWDKLYKVRAGKTGTTEDAGHCMLITVEIDGKPYTMTFMGGESANSRFLDFAKVAHHLDSLE
jgi:serine-type D-Ala-D-Ala endopeptidase (penicillin-binding protein 7)